MKRREKEEEEKREEVSYSLAGKKAEDSAPQGESKSQATPSPLPSIAEDEVQKQGVAAFISPDKSKDDLLQFTSATEGESSSAWELVPGQPEKKIAGKSPPTAILTHLFLQEPNQVTLRRKHRSLINS